MERILLILLRVKKRGSRGLRLTQSDEGQNDDALGNFDLIISKKKLRFYS
jgi:hypothetical protein